MIISHCSKDQQEEIVHDVEAAIKKTHEWKAHLMRTTHQEAAKSTVLAKLTSSQVFITMDWAMKSLSVFEKVNQNGLAKREDPGMCL